MIEATPPNLDVRDLITSLSSKTCPACGGAKRPRHTLCGRDYGKLPAQVKANLYCRVGNGYAEAVAAAMQILGATEFKLPPAVNRPPLRPEPGLFGGRS